MKKKTILGIPSIYFYIICLILMIGIIVGSFYDFQISEALSNKTEIGDFFQKYGNTLSNFLYIIAGICIFKGLRKKGTKYNLLAWSILIYSIFWSIQCDLTLSGKYLREAYGYAVGESGSFIPLAFSFLTWIGISILVAVIAYMVIDDENSNQLLIVGAIILVAGVISIQINEWLKVLGNRPRYKYLITLNDPISEYRNWWQMRPYFSSDSLFKSWPSGHMTYATIMLCLPMLFSALKPKNKWLKYVGFVFAVVWIIIFGYNRIHMNAHFLTDVCFAVLITYCLYAIVYKLIIWLLPNNE